MNVFKTKKGFTLVEVIVVLVILAILAAIMIPSFSGWIDKAHEKRCFSEQGQIMRDYHANVANVGYGALAAVDTGELLNEAVKDICEKYADSDTSYTCSGGGTCTVTFAANGLSISSISCSLHGSLVSSGAVTGSISYDGGPSPDASLMSGTLAMIFATNSPETDRFISPGKAVDSTATNGQRNLNISDYLENTLSVKLGDSGIQSWKIFNPTSSKINASNADRLEMYWTDTDISTLTAGSSVNVIKYVNGSYAVGTMTVAKKSGDNYMVLNAENDSFVQDASFAATTDYASAVRDFNTLS